MEYDVDDDTPLNVLVEYAKLNVELANKILSDIDSLNHKIENLKKFRKRVSSERDFLISLVTGEVTINKSHVTCSNLPHFQAILDSVHSEVDVIAVQKVFLFKQTDQEDKASRFEVDIVSKNGGRWIKVKAMKAEAIQNIFHGNGNYGTKSISMLGKQLIQCAQQHLYHYRPPQCVMWFTKGVTEDVVEELEDMGIVVKGNIQNESDVVEKPQTPREEIENAEPITIVNLDVTAIITLVSHVTNGGAYHNFNNHILQTQAIEERQEPTLPRVHQFMKDKNVIVTKTAWEKFDQIVKIVGGDSEKKRAEELKAMVMIVEDCPSEMALSLKLGPKIKQQHIDIFGTGDYHKATTITANVAFTRVASEQGVEFSVFMHPARALTEQKAIPPTEPLQQNHDTILEKEIDD